MENEGKTKTGLAGKKDAPSVSIVLPVYNVGAYIGECIDSICAQSWNRLECILVDDCGTDAGMEVAKERVQKYLGGGYDRIQVFAA